MTAGRHGDLPIGVEPEDAGVSRIAVKVAVDDDGWVIHPTNANGVVVCPWGQPARWADLNRDLGIRWPMVGLRLVGTETELAHWVLLENPAFSIDLQLGRQDSTNTAIARPPTPLTDPQHAAVRAIFGQHLSWPPVPGPAPATLQAAASRLGVSHAAVYQRLEAVRERAYQFGSPQQVGVSDPEYVYALVRAGHLRPPDLEDGNLEHVASS